MTDQKERPVVHLMFAHPVTAKGGKKAGKWRRVELGATNLDRDVVLEEAHIYTGRDMLKKPGAIYAFECDSLAEFQESGAIYTKSACFVRTLPPDQRVEWEALAAAYENEIESRSREGQLMPAGYELLEPLREAYRRRIGRRARATVLAQFIQYITG